MSKQLDERTDAAVQMNNNELWRLEAGFIAGYTEDAKLIQRIRRYKFNKGWQIMGEYFDLKTKTNKRIGVQFKIPIEHRKAAERMFQVKLTK